MIYLIAVGLLCLAVSTGLLYFAIPRGLRTAHPDSRVRQRPSAKPATNYKEQLNEWWQRAGFSYSPLANILVVFSVIFATYSSFRLFGYRGMVIGALGSVLFMLALAQWRRSNIKKHLIRQLPSFIDQVSRRIKVGMSVQRAIEQSTKSVHPPLSNVLERVSQRQGVGIELQDAFYREYLITGVSSFRLLGSIFNINTRYGGSINESLDSLVELLRQQDLSQRELRSITGETRITAWVIGSAPATVGMYMLSQNPELLINMWDSDGGRSALIFGLILQLTGIILIWRMFRSL